MLTPWTRGLQTSEAIIRSGQDGARSAADDRRSTRRQHLSSGNQGHSDGVSGETLNVWAVTALVSEAIGMATERIPAMSRRDEQPPFPATSLPVRVLVIDASEMMLEVMRQVIAVARRGREAGLTPASRLSTVSPTLRAHRRRDDRRARD